MIVVAISAINFFCFWRFCGQTKEFYSFEPGSCRPRLATGGLRIVVLVLKSHCEFSHYFFKTRFILLFDFILYVPVNNFSVMSGWVFLG